MPNLEKARAGLNRIETVLRSRYNYAHPIFGYVAEVREALEGDLPEAAPPAKKAVKSRKGKAKRMPKAEAPAEPGPEPEGEGEPIVEPGPAENEGEVKYV